MKKKLVTICQRCDVECRGEGFIASPLQGALIGVSVVQCPECMRLVPMTTYGLLDANQRAFIAEINGESEERSA